MKLETQIAFVLFVLILFSLPVSVFAAIGDIVIQEVLFNPSDKSDTGLEYIIVKNKSSENINLTGWDLYPAGIGYFTFPSFSLASQGEVKINLNKSGTNDGSNLYQGNTSNMGDSSGSIAIFSNTQHNKDTIQAFVRYHKPGSSENKTWETAASDASIWQKGDFVNIDSLVAGQVIFLSDSNNFKSSAGWSIKTLAEGSSVATSTSDANVSEPESTTESTSGAGSVSWPAEPQIYANAGKDKTVIVGTDVYFSGQALGIEKEPLENARYLWNFGDGAIAENQNVKHVYQYPGEYIAVLDISSGKFSTSDNLLVKAIPNQLKISEANQDFIKLSNGSNVILDISDWVLRAGNETFKFPASTFIKANSALMIPFSVSGIKINANEKIELLYSNWSAADSFINVRHSVSNISTTELTSYVDSKESAVKTQISPPNNSTSSVQTASVITVSKNDFWTPKKWWGLIILIGILSGAGFLFVRHKTTVSKL
ncbi:MAG: PKD domain-containing protein [Candidatus Parcubacteria bacterium]|nr:PKD domain-containing protein [Candidatus Parcubacteria bacterium]